MKSDNELDERARNELSQEQVEGKCASLSKAKAKAVERGVKAAITAVVRKCGGDEKTGGDLLGPDLEPYGWGHTRPL